jgi:hypothetical protein
MRATRSVHARRIWALLGPLSLAFAPAAARAAQPSAEDEARMEALLPLHPALTGLAAVGLAVFNADSHGDLGLGAALRADSNLVPPLWFTGKARLTAGNADYDFQGDLSAGLVVSQSRGPDNVTCMVKTGSDARFDYYKTGGVGAIVRKTWTAAAGAKVYTAAPVGGSRMTQVGITAGMQFLEASNWRSFEGLDLVAVWNPAASGFGAALDYHLCLPIYPRFVASTQVAWLPVDVGAGHPGHQILLTLELGFAFGT